MKKIFTFLFLSLSIASLSHAAIIIRGKRTGTEHGAGDTSFRCKGNTGECVRIETSARLAILPNPDGSIAEQYTFESYTTKESIENGETITRVTLIKAVKK
jgi:hypothetical protein